MELYNYFRSSASYRVRIGLALKGLDYDYHAVHLPTDEQTAESYAAVSASRLVPLLKDARSARLAGELLTIELESLGALRAVWQSPFTLADGVLESIARETAHAKAGRKASTSAATSCPKMRG